MTSEEDTLWVRVWSETERDYGYADGYVAGAAALGGLIGMAEAIRANYGPRCCCRSCLARKLNDPCAKDS